MLAGVQGCQHQVAVHIGPSADAYGVDAVVVQQLAPVVVDFGDFVFGGDALAGLAAAVGDGDDFGAALLAEAGDVAQAGVGPGANQADADDSVLHQLDSLAGMVWGNSITGGGITRAGRRMGRVWLIML